VGHPGDQCGGAGAGSLYRWSDQIKDLQNRQALLEQPYMVEENGQMQLDLSKASEEDRMMLALIKRDELQTRNLRADAFNRRSLGIRIIGISVLGFALAYLVAPERKRGLVPDDSGPVPPSPDEPPFDLSE